MYKNFGFDFKIAFTDSKMSVAILFTFVSSCLQLLAWPLLSMVYPLYASIEALERNSISDTQKLISYWICFAAISLFEYSTSVLLHWVPFWAYVKLLIICCLVAPQFDGSMYMYKRFIHRYKNMKKRFCLIVSFILLEAVNYFGEIEADQASQSSKEVQQPNLQCRTEPKDIAGVEQTENARVGETNQITDIIAGLLLESNEIEDKSSCEECRIECIDVTAVERIENAGGGSTEQVTEITTEISLDHVEDRDSQDSSSIEKVQKEWTCEVCEVRISSVSDLQLHLQGKQHKVACEILKSKNQATTRELLKTHQPINNIIPPGYATSVDLPIVPCNGEKQGAAKSCTNEIKYHQWWTALCNISCTSKGDMDAHLNGSKHLAEIQKSHGDGNTGKTAVIPKLKAERRKRSKQDQLAKEKCQKHTKQVLVCWQFPEPGQIKINVDGSVSKKGRRAGCGGVFRDKTGHWIFGFAHNLGSSSILEAELWGIHTALDLARKKEFNNICVESDSLKAINLVKQGCVETHPQAAIVHAITYITKSSNMEVSFQHTLREGNRVADWLAKWSHHKGVGVHEVRNPPDECRTILLEDRTGVGFLRIVKSV